MQNRFKDLLVTCSEIELGAVNLSEREKKFCSDLNDEIISLCESLPISTQTDALLLLMRHLRTFIGEDLNFFSSYYAPAWSIIYWLANSGSKDNGLSKIDIQNASTSHSMAIFLHPLDDHLNDHEWPVSHLTLLLRSQAWMIMINAFNRLADGIHKGHQMVQDFINDYYAGICGCDEIESLDTYCDLFRKQMATWLIVPVLMTKKMTTDEVFSNAVQKAYGSFGIAWRLVDDLKDIEPDMMKSYHSAIYYCLPHNLKALWDHNAGKKLTQNSGPTAVILDYLQKNKVVERIKERICSELESGASIADECDVAGLADEFRCLLRPLKNRRDD